MEIFQAIFLGVVQGIGEFLPISSSGHLVIVGDLLNKVLGQSPTSDEKMLLNITLHAGTLFSILCVYRHEILKLRLQPRVCLLIVVASVPAALLGFTLKDLFEQVFSTPLIAGVALFVTAGLLLLGQRLERAELSYEDLSVRSTIVIGLCQAVALVPGISRSGSTISGGLAMGMRRESAAAFSFLMAIPVIGGAALLEVKDIFSGEVVVEEPVALAAGGATAFLVGLLSLRWLVSLIGRGKLHWFAYYCLGAGTLTLVWQLVSAVMSVR